MENKFFINKIKENKSIYSYRFEVIEIFYKYIKLLNFTNKNLYKLIFVIFFFKLINFIPKNTKLMIKYKNYINDCNNLKRFNISKLINNKIPYISICLPVYNMEKYIERSLLSVINQSFQDFEIIIVNDNSIDNTVNIIKNLQKEYNRIRIINHDKNLGVYSSRVESIINSKGKYILLMDPDDLLLKQDLFQKLFNYNLKYNLDIIEFSVFHQKEGRKTIYSPSKHELNHYHKFEKNIIYQPELSDIIFYKPKTKKYTDVICRTVWNKLIKKNIILQSINYIEKFFHGKYLITADDTPINILNFNFAKNYSNIYLPGYLYNIRTHSMSNGKNGNIHDKIVSINYLLYFKFFYSYIKDFKKDLNYLYYDLKISSKYILNIKKLKIIEYFPTTVNFFETIINDEKASNEFKKYIYHLLSYFI